MTMNPDTLRKFIDYHGGPLAAAERFSVNRRKMQRIYAGKESCPTGLAREMIADIRYDLEIFTADSGVAA